MHDAAIDVCPASSQYVKQELLMISVDLRIDHHRSGLSMIRAAVPAPGNASMLSRCEYANIAPMHDERRLASAAAVKQQAAVPRTDAVQREAPAPPEVHLSITTQAH